MNYDQIMQNLLGWKRKQHDDALEKIKEVGELNVNDVQFQMNSLEWLEKFERLMNVPNQPNRFSELRDEYGKKRQ